MNYIILNDVNSNTIQGLLIQNLPPITKPKIRTNIEEIDGRDGDIITKLGYSAYEKEFDIGLYGNYDVDQVISYFNSEGTVIFSNEDDKFYKYSIIEQIDFERLIRFKTAKVKMHVQPFKYSNTDTDIEIYATETDAEGTNLTINNTENGASFLDMQLKGQTTQDGTPTPSAPVNVNVVTGNTSVKICNKNLLNYNAFVKGRINSSTGQIEYASNVTSIIINNNVITFTVTQAWNSGITSDYIPVEQGYYTYKGTFGAIKGGVYIDLYGADKTWLSRYGNQTINANETKTWTININNVNAKYIRLHYEIDTAGTTTITNSQLEKGNTATSYIAHQEQNYEINLGINELCQIGQYQDYIHKNNGNWFIHKEIGKVVLDGTQGTFSKPSTNRFNIDNAFKDYYKQLNSTTYLSNFYVAYGQKRTNADFNSLVTNVDYGFDLTNDSTTYNIRIKDTRYDDITQFKNWLSNNNLILYYALATPTETQITDENLIAQLEGLRGASTYINQTNIITSGDLAPIIYVNVDTIDTNEIEVINSGNIYSKPVVTITGIGTINLYLNDYQVFIIELGDTETTITLDVENMEAYNINTGQLMNRQVTGDYNNFIFNSGTNIITWSGTIASVQVVNYSRWI